MNLSRIISYLPYFRVAKVVATNDLPPSNLRFIPFVTDSCVLIVKSELSQHALILIENHKDGESITCLWKLHGCPPVSALWMFRPPSLKLYSLFDMKFRTIISRSSCPCSSHPSPYETQATPPVSLLVSAQDTPSSPTLSSLARSHPRRLAQTVQSRP